MCPFHHLLEDGKKGNNTNKNEVFCNPSQSSITLVNGKGPTNNEKKKGKSFIKTFLSSLINHAPLLEEWKGLNNDKNNNN